jgi:hypothetical protein
MTGPRRRRSVASLWLFVLGFCARADAGDDRGEPALSLSDLAPYRAALEGKPAGPAESVTFRELWDHPERHQGRRVRVEGRVVRRFRQEAFGTFPPLVEAWAVSPAGDPFCLIFPAPTGPSGPGTDPAPGASVRFEGTFLRRLRYQGGDTDRLAPLIVGDRPPSVTSAAPRPGNPLNFSPNEGRRARVDWAIGLVAAVFVALVLAYRHTQAPPRRPQKPGRDLEPPPEFVDPA